MSLQLSSENEITLACYVPAYMCTLLLAAPVPVIFCGSCRRPVRCQDRSKASSQPSGNFLPGWDGRGVRLGSTFKLDLSALAEEPGDFAFTRSVTLTTAKVKAR